MNATTRNLLQTILINEGGYFSLEQGRALMQDEATRRLPVVIRYYWGRESMPLVDAVVKLSADTKFGWDEDLRDWFLPASECDRLMPLVGVEHDVIRGYVLREAV
jgi:hypothetical protein